MKRLILIVFLFPLILLGQESMETDSRKLDFGTIKKGDDRIREIQMRNISRDTVDVLRMKVPSAEYSVKFSTKEVAPGEKLLIRVKYNPKEKGAFNDELTLFLSDMIVDFKSTGKVDYLEWDDFTPCPDFEKSAEDRSTDFDVLIKVIDKDTRDPIPNAQVTLVGRTKGVFEIETNRKGEVVTQVPIDYYDISARAKGYGKYNMDSYINRRNKNFTLALLKGEKSSTVVLRPNLPETDTALEEEEEVTIEIQQEEPQETAEDPASVMDEGEFSEAEFAPNNVVFLIDVSTSMRKEDRLEILKSSMIELTQMLRPTDVLTVITYASSTEVVISGQHVIDKQAIIKVISELEGTGLTAGEAGIKKAYVLAKRHRIEGGNNQVYLATDGAFNKGGEKIERMVRKEARKGTHMSVLAIRGSKWSKDKMQHLAKAGKGTYLPIDEMESASDELKSLIKEQAAKRK